MLTRTSSSTIVFAEPFRVADEVLPAGRYIVEVEEELLDTLTVTAYRRVATVIHRDDSSGMMRWITVEPAELEAAIARDLRH